MIARSAADADLPAIRDIYNAEVLHGTSTFDTEPVTVDERREWLRAHSDPRRPAVVACDGDLVVGWASLSEWSTRCAYARAAEVSIYVHAEHRGRGVGRLLLAELIARGRAAGLGVLLARIAGGSGASRRLHESAGFDHIGTMHRVGEKLGRILDVELFELMLD